MSLPDQRLGMRVPVEERDHVRILGEDLARGCAVLPAFLSDEIGRLLDSVPGEGLLDIPIDQIQRDRRGGRRGDDLPVDKHDGGPPRPRWPSSIASILRKSGGLPCFPVRASAQPV